MKGSLIVGRDQTRFTDVISSIIELLNQNKKAAPVSVLCPHFHKIKGFCFGLAMMYIASETFNSESQFREQMIMGMVSCMSDDSLIDLYENKNLTADQVIFTAENITVEEIISVFNKICLFQNIYEYKVFSQRQYDKIIHHRMIRCRFCKNKHLPLEKRLSHLLPAVGLYHLIITDVRGNHTIVIRINENQTNIFYFDANKSVNSGFGPLDTIQSLAKDLERYGDAKFIYAYHLRKIDDFDKKLEAIHKKLLINKESKNKSIITSIEKYYNNSISQIPLVFALIRANIIVTDQKNDDYNFFSSFLRQ
ncbi:MAG: hypothetical protein JSR33_03900, partial [Proteobacteria bacterium]|nr:hypothetical protein [Pseudomonadota bacterium]